MSSRDPNNEEAPSTDIRKRSTRQQNPSMKRKAQGNLIQSTSSILIQSLQMKIRWQHSRRRLPAFASVWKRKREHWKRGVRCSHTLILADFIKIPEVAEIDGPESNDGPESEDSVPEDVMASFATGVGFYCYYYYFLFHSSARLSHVPDPTQRYGDNTSGACTKTHSDSQEGIWDPTP